MPVTLSAGLAWGPPSKHTSPVVDSPPSLTAWASTQAASPPVPRAGETGRVHPEHSPGSSITCCQQGGAISLNQCTLRERGGHGQPHGVKPAPGLAGLSGVFRRSQQFHLQNVPVAPSPLPGLVPLPLPDPRVSEARELRAGRGPVPPPGSDFSCWNSSFEPVMVPRVPRDDNMLTAPQTGGVRASFRPVLPAIQRTESGSRIDVGPSRSPCKVQGPSRPVILPSCSGKSWT